MVGSSGRPFRRFGLKYFTHIQLLIGINNIVQKLPTFAAIALTTVSTSCSNGVSEEVLSSKSSQAIIPVSLTHIEYSSEKPVQTWTEEEVEAMARILAGECYEDKVQDKRLVCEVILNRVSNDDFSDTILDVLTEKNQFDSYWKQYRPVSKNDYEVVIQTLEDWYENDCKALSDYLFFEAGDNHENKFRKEFNKTNF